MLFLLCMLSVIPFENGRPAYAPVRDEQRPVGLEFSAGEACRDVGNDNAHQAFERVRFERETEQRRHGRHRFQLQRIEKRRAARSRAAARRDDNRFGRDTASARETYLVTAALLRLDAFRAGTGFNGDAVPLHQPQQRADDVLCVLRTGKHALVVLHRERHALRLKPAHRVAVVERVEQAFHQPCAARVHRFEAAHLLERVGEVAASAARYRHLCQWAVEAFVHADVCLRHSPRRLYGREATRRACADNGNGHESGYMLFSKRVYK